MNFTDQIALIEAAAGDSRKLALTVLDLILASQQPELLRVIEAAAVLRWFDEVHLAAVLDDDLRPEVSTWFVALTRLAAVEALPARKAWNIHETTRLALRNRIFANDPQRFTSLAARAMNAYIGPRFSERIERAYHSVAVDPAAYSGEIRAVEYDARAKPEQSLALAQALGEYVDHDAWPASTRGWSVLFAAKSYRPYRTLTKTLQDCYSSLRSFEQSGLGEGIACALFELGESLVTRGQSGDAEQALGYFERALQIREDLLVADPQSAQAGRDVSVSLNKLGDFLAQRSQSGDAEQALGYFERGLQIGEGLLMANPQSAQAGRDVSVSLNKLGDFLAQRGQSGDAEQTLRYFERALKIREDLLVADPQSAQAGRDVSVCLNKLGDFLAQRGQSGDAVQALGYFERALRIREVLLVANPQSAQAGRDVSVCLNKLGDFLAQRGQSGDAVQALGYFERNLKISERLLMVNPQLAQSGRDVWVSLNKLGDLLAQRGQSGDAEQALGYFERGLQISERLLMANPQSAQAARDVLVSHQLMSHFHQRHGKAEDEITHKVQSLAILDAFALAGRPMNPQMRQLHDHLKASFSKPGA